MMRAVTGWPCPTTTVVLLLVFTAAAHGAGRDAPTQSVEDAIHTLQAGLLRDEAGLRDTPCRLYALLGAAMDPYVDFTRMGRLVMGQSRREATPGQQRDFNVQFRAWLLALAARALSRYVLGRGLLGRLTISYRPVRLFAGGTKAEVPTTLSLAGILRFDVRLRLHRDNDRWLIYDIRAEGFSLIAAYRTILADKVHERGLDGAIRWLRARSTRLRQGFAASSEGCE